MPGQRLTITLYNLRSSLPGDDADNSNNDGDDDNDAKDEDGGGRRKKKEEYIVDGETENDELKYSTVMGKYKKYGSLRRNYADKYVFDGSGKRHLRSSRKRRVIDIYQNHNHKRKTLKKNNFDVNKNTKDPQISKTTSNRKMNFKRKNRKNYGRVNWRMRLKNSTCCSYQVVGSTKMLKNRKKIKRFDVQDNVKEYNNIVGNEADANQAHRDEDLDKLNGTVYYYLKNANNNSQNSTLIIKYRKKSFRYSANFQADSMSYIDKNKNSIKKYQNRKKINEMNTFFKNKKNKKNKFEQINNSIKKLRNKRKSTEKHKIVCSFALINEFELASGWSGKKDQVLGRSEKKEKNMTKKGFLNQNALRQQVNTDGVNSGGEWEETGKEGLWMRLPSFGHNSRVACVSGKKRIVLKHTTHGKAVSLMLFKRPLPTTTDPLSHLSYHFFNTPPPYSSSHFHQPPHSSKHSHEDQEFILKFEGQSSCLIAVSNCFRLLGWLLES